MNSHLDLSTKLKMSEDKNLRKAGLKVTLPRVRILEIFEQSDEKHLSAEDVYNKIRDSGDEVGLATVYRVLTQFESAGILDIVSNSSTRKQPLLAHNSKIFFILFKSSLVKSSTFILEIFS